MVLHLLQVSVQSMAKQKIALYQAHNALRSAVFWVTLSKYPSPNPFATAPHNSTPFPTLRSLRSLPYVTSLSPLTTSLHHLKHVALPPKPSYSATRRDIERIGELDIRELYHRPLMYRRGRIMTYWEEE